MVHEVQCENRMQRIKSREFDSGSHGKIMYGGDRQSAVKIWQNGIRYMDDWI